MTITAPIVSFLCEHRLSPGNNYWFDRTAIWLLIGGRVLDSSLAIRGCGFPRKDIITNAIRLCREAVPRNLAEFPRSMKVMSVETGSSHG